MFILDSLRMQELNLRYKHISQQLSIELSEPFYSFSHHLKSGCFGAYFCWGFQSESQNFYLIAYNFRVINKIQQMANLCLNNFLYVYAAK